MTTRARDTPDQSGRPARRRLEFGEGDGDGSGGAGGRVVAADGSGRDRAVTDGIPSALASGRSTAVARYARNYVPRVSRRLRAKIERVAEEDTERYIKYERYLVPRWDKVVTNTEELNVADVYTCRMDIGSATSIASKQAGFEAKDLDCPVSGWSNSYRSVGTEWGYESALGCGPGSYQALRHKESTWQRKETAHFNSGSGFVLLLGDLFPQSPSATFQDMATSEWDLSGRLVPFNPLKPLRVPRLRIDYGWVEDPSYTTLAAVVSAGEDKPAAVAPCYVEVIIGMIKSTEALQDQMAASGLQPEELLLRQLGTQNAIDSTVPQPLGRATKLTNANAEGNEAIYLDCDASKIRRWGRWRDKSVIPDLFHIVKRDMYKHQPKARDSAGEEAKDGERHIGVVDMDHMFGRGSFTFRDLELEMCTELANPSGGSDANQMIHARSKWDPETDVETTGGIRSFMYHMRNLGNDVLNDRFLLPASNDTKSTINLCQAGGNVRANVGDTNPVCTFPADPIACKFKHNIPFLYVRGCTASMQTAKMTSAGAAEDAARAVVADDAYVSDRKNETAGIMNTMPMFYVGDVSGVNTRPNTSGLNFRCKFEVSYIYNKD